MDLATWELLSYVVTVVGLPFAIGVFLYELVMPNGHGDGHPEA
jgi:hypothetical protein